MGNRELEERFLSGQVLFSSNLKGKKSEKNCILKLVLKHFNTPLWVLTDKEVSSTVFCEVAKETICTLRDESEL